LDGYPVDVGGQQAQRLAIDVGARDPPSLPCKMAGDRLPDAVCGAGDDDCAGVAGQWHGSDKFPQSPAKASRDGNLGKASVHSLRGRPGAGPRRKAISRPPAVNRPTPAPNARPPEPTAIRITTSGGLTTYPSHGPLARAPRTGPSHGPLARAPRTGPSHGPLTQAPHAGLAADAK